ncbi:MAG: hypothetical protein HOP02_00975 [Methylococcaceae bacterium]|nr:hypothetical protein [Methylococcaceae bacterium]
MKILKVLIIFSCYIVSMNIYALEIRYDGFNCTTDQANPPPIQSRMIVTSQTGNFFMLKIKGGLPPLNISDNTCVDSLFRTGNSELPEFYQEGKEGYAIFSAPFLYVFVNGTVGGNVLNSKRNYPTQHLLKFSLTGDNSFLLLRDDWFWTLGQDDQNWTANGAVQSETTLYDQTNKSVKYTLIK